MKRDAKIDAEEFARQSDAIEAAIQNAVRDALIEHKIKGQSIVVCEPSGQPVWIPASEIEIPDPPANPSG